MSKPVQTKLGRALADLKATPAPLPHITKPPSDFTPRVEVEPGKSATIVTRSSVTDGPEAPDTSDRDQIIRDNGLNPANWVVTSWRRATWQRHDGEWLESFRCTLAPCDSIDAVDASPMPDMDDIHRAVQRVKRSVKPKPVAAPRALVVSMADFQAGKVDFRGGSHELFERLEVSRERFRAHARKVKPSEIILIDSGDAMEGFENVASQERGNDLSLTEQIRFIRRVFWSWVETAAPLAPKVTFAGVGSNHCRVRRGKNNLGAPSDDFGVEMVAQLADMASVNPEKYGWVSFHTPSTFDEAVLLPLPGGKSLGVVHGHQVSAPAKIPAWWAQQALGRTIVGDADYLVTGHFHHLSISVLGDGRVHLQSPTSDNGSSWYRNFSGNDSPPGVMSFVVESDGSWGNLAVL